MSYVQQKPELATLSKNCLLKYETLHWKTRKKT